MNRLSGLLGAVCALVFVAGCCPPERCGPTPEILLTVRSDGALAPEAVAIVTSTGDAFESNGCRRAGPDWGCTHELRSISGHGDLREPIEDGRVGYGPWRPNVDIPVRLRVELEGAGEPIEVDVRVHVDRCGIVESPNVVVDFTGQEATATVERGPHGCERP